MQRDHPPITLQNQQGVDTNSLLIEITLVIFIVKILFWIQKIVLICGIAVVDRFHFRRGSLISKIRVSWNILPRSTWGLVQIEINRNDGCSARFIIDAWWRNRVADFLPLTELGGGREVSLICVLVSSRIELRRGPPAWCVWIGVVTVIFLACPEVYCLPYSL